MFQSYTKKIQRIEEDVSRIVESAYASLENSGDSFTYNNSLSYVKMKEIKCVIYNNYVKLNAIAKITLDGAVEYRIRGFQVKSRSYYNYPLDRIPLEIKAQIADYLTKKVKLPRFTIVDTSVTI